MYYNFELDGNAKIDTIIPFIYILFNQNNMNISHFSRKEKKTQVGNALEFNVGISTEFLLYNKFENNWLITEHMF